SITGQPQSLAACLGSPVTFSVTASVTDGDALTYQWQKNTVNIAGATGASYTIASVAAGDAASYRVVVTDNSGVCTQASTSSAATLSQSSQTVTGVSNPIFSPDQASSAGVKDNTVITIRNPATV